MFDKPSRKKDDALKKTYCKKYCIVCNKYGSEPHHLISVGAGGPDEDWNMVALCRIHHHEIHNIGLFSFSKKYISFVAWLIAMSWSLNPQENKWEHYE